MSAFYIVTLAFTVGLNDVSANGKETEYTGEDVFVEVGCYKVSDFPPSYSTDEVTPFMGGGSIQLLNSTFNFNDRMTSSSFKLASGKRGTA